MFKRRNPPPARPHRKRSLAAPSNAPDPILDSAHQRLDDLLEMLTGRRS